MAELSAFAGCAAVLPAHEGATAVPVEGLSVVSVTAWRGQEASLVDAARATFGLTLPEAGRWTAHDGLVASWVGPGHWWLQREHRPGLPDDLAALADHAALIDMSHARAVLRLSGPAARDMLASLLPLDMHPRGFAPGRVATTLAAHLTVQVRQIDAVPSYELSCLRSYAGSLWRALELAGAGRLRMMVQPA